jgi:protein-S-isoprenylcysteine O-methyltransferase Ste14
MAPEAHGLTDVTDPDDRPGVLAPPPLVYLAALVAGVALHLFLPLTLRVPTYARWLGVGLVVVAVALAVSARTTFTRAGTNVNPYLPATALVTSGPFRFSRNPMYVAMAIALAGLALWTRIGWILILLPVAVAVLHLGVVRREERYLARKFGADYEAYRARVRRYV